MHHTDQQRWLERLARRPVPEDEVAAVRRQAAADPEFLARMQEEEALTRLLARLPDAPVAGNFAARVQAAIDAEERLGRRDHPAAWWPSLARLVPRLAVGSAVVAVAMLGVLQYRAMVRERFASSVASIVWPVAAAAHVTHLPPADFLRDFDAIRELQRSAALADGDLLAALAPEVATP